MDEYPIVDAYHIDGVGLLLVQQIQHALVVLPVRLYRRGGWGHEIHWMQASLQNQLVSRIHQRLQDHHRIFGSDPGYGSGYSQRGRRQLAVPQTLDELLFFEEVQRIGGIAPYL